MTFTPVRFHMNRDVAVVPYAASLEHVAEALLRSGADASVVVHDDGRIAGLVGERELVFGGMAVAEGAADHSGAFAETRFVTAYELDPVASVYQRMFEKRARRAVIVDEAGLVSGLVSVKSPRPQPTFESPYEEARP